MGFSISQSQLQQLANDLRKHGDDAEVGLSKEGNLLVSSSSRKVKKADTERLQKVMNAASQETSSDQKFSPKRKSIFSRKAKPITAGEVRKTLPTQNFKDRYVHDRSCHELIQHEKLCSKGIDPKQIKPSDHLPEDVARLLQQDDKKHNEIFMELGKKSKDLLKKDQFDGDKKAIDSRYNNIVPPKSTIIKLDSNDGNPRFFHGNRLRDGKFITTQHVKQSSTPAFFETLYNNRVHTIKNLTNLSTEVQGDRWPGKNSGSPAFDYWPPLGGKEKHGDFEVQTRDIEQHDGYKIVSIQIRKNESKKAKAVKIYHFENWPDHGVPSGESLKQYQEYLKACQKNDEGKSSQRIMVHCLAGVGRTGTNILIDKMIIAIDEGKITLDNFEQHLYENLWELRQDGGTDMVQQSTQLQFARSFLLEHLKARITLPQENNSQAGDPSLDESESLYANIPMKVGAPEDTSSHTETREQYQDDEPTYVNWTPPTGKHQAGRKPINKPINRNG